MVPNWREGAGAEGPRRIDYPVAPALAALLLALQAPAARAADADGFRRTLSPHFEIRHQADFLPRGLLMDLGRLHGALSRDLSLFAPWLGRERVLLHLYADRRSYVQGDAKPPEWSNGMAFFRRRLIVTYVQPRRERTLSVLAHEMAHLLFEGYWGEAGKVPPVWLNEGLAMMMEDPRDGEETEWAKAMRAMTASGRWVPFERFFEVEPARDLAESDKGAVTLWYVQAYSVVRFLHERYTRLQFFSFCRALRDGEPLERALWQAFRLGGAARFEEAWRAWMKLPAGSAAGAARRSGGRKGEKVLSPAGFREFRFHGLGDRKK